MGDAVAASIFWYDYETTGINPRADRAFQVAGVRTDEALNIIEPPLNLYCRLSDDILPHPQACLVTGVTPQLLTEQGLSEASFMAQIHAQIARPGTCTAGYNSVRFDDEVTRHSLFRNFYDPYAREWQGGNSRWDVIDVLRTAFALRPEGIEWPMQDGQPSLRLELLSAANGLAHEHAHDALSDVYATIALAKLVRERQPKLYEYLYRLRTKARVLELIRLLQPMVHISGRFSVQRSYLSVVLPLAWHPTNRNALIVCDLQSDCSPLLEESAEVLRERLYMRRDALLPGQLPVPLKLVHVNRCPVLLPLNVLREQDQQRLNIDLALCLTQAKRLSNDLPQWQHKLLELYRSEAFSGVDDPEQSLYDGFLNDHDRRMCEQIRGLEPAQLASRNWSFDDSRLAELLFRYRARNAPQTLSADEHMIWWEFCRQRLGNEQYGAPNTLQQFEQAWDHALSTGLAVEQVLLLDEWRQYVAALKQRYQIV